MIDIEKINSNLLHSIAFGFDARLQIPEIKYINAVNPEELRGLRTNGKWIEDSGMMIRKKDGVRIVCIDFWDGEKFCYPHIAINDRRLLNGNQGPELEANSVTLFRNIDRICVDEFRKVASLISQREPTYQGYVTLDVTISETDTWFNGIQFGLVDDYIFLLSKLYVTDVSEDVPDWKSPASYNFVCSLRLWSYPYSVTGNLKIPERLPENEMDLVVSDEGPIVLSGGKRIYDCWKNLYDSMPANLENLGICYRTDGDFLPKKSYHELKFMKKMGGMKWPGGR